MRPPERALPIAPRLAAQLLSGQPARDPVAVVERLLAVQAQDPRGARLAIRARTAGLSATDVDRALTVDRSLCISWLCRRTLHLVRREDFGWLQVLTTPPLHTGNARRLAQEGVTPAAAERGVGVVERSLAAEGPLTREQLRERIHAAGVRTEGQALVHILELASLRGLILRGPMAGGRHAFVLVRDWFGEPAAVDRDAALAELARRYLAGHGPATDRDLAKWAGLPLRDVRRGLSAIASELDQHEDGLVDLAARPRVEDLPPPRLLGAFDPVLHGWTSRAPVLGGHDAQVVSGGLFRPFALAGGRGVGVWRLSGRAVEVTPFEPLDDEVLSALRVEGEDVVRFLGIRARG